MMLVGWMNESPETSDLKWDRCLQMRKGSGHRLVPAICDHQSRIGSLLSESKQICHFFAAINRREDGVKEEGEKRRRRKKEDERRARRKGEEGETENAYSN